MDKEIFTKIIKDIPVKEYGIKGLEVHYSHTKEGTIWFVQAHEDVVFPEHSHGEQWTVVVDGEADCIIEGKPYVYKKGDVYTIPANAKHNVTLKKGYTEVTYTNNPLDGDE